MRKGYAATSAVFVLENEGHRREMLGYLASLVIVPHRARWRVTIEPDTNKRTYSQLKRMWSVLRYIAANAWVPDTDTGVTKQFPAEAWHDFFCGKFIGWEEIPGGQRVPIGTSSQNTKENNEFVDRVIAYATDELNVDFAHWERETA